MTYDGMFEMTNKDLVKVYNDLATETGDKQLPDWRQAKTKLIERIETLQAKIDDAEIDAEDDGLLIDGEEMSPEEAEDLAAGAEDLGVSSGRGDSGDALPVAGGVETEAEEEPKRTIKSVAVDLLCATAYHENRDEKSSDENRVAEDHPKARTVGITYDEIIRRIQDEFEGCNTSVACLRWYSVKIRVGEHGYEGLRLPQRRPRAKPKTAG